MVLIFSDDKKLTFELLNKGSEISKDLGEKLIALIIGKSNDALVQEYISYGADNVFIVETDLDTFKAEEYASLLENVINETKSETIIIGSNKNGKELASRLAGRLDAGCIIDCTNIYLTDKKLTSERVVYSGNAIAIEQFNTKPAILTVPSKAYDPLPKDDKRKGEIVKKKFDVEKSASKILKAGIFTSTRISRTVTKLKMKI